MTPKRKRKIRLSKPMLRGPLRTAPVIRQELFPQGMLLRN